MKRNDHYHELFLICFATLIFITIIVCYRSYRLYQELSELKPTIDTLAQTLSISNNSIQTENTQSLLFLQNESAKYREFIENQQDHLIGLFGILGSGIVGLLAFFGIKTKKEIEETVQQHYIEQIQKEISDTIGGEKKKPFLIKSIQKEEDAHSKKILFILQEPTNENLHEVYEQLKAQEYTVSDTKILNTDFKQLITQNDIIIYEVGKDEFINNSSQPDKDVRYAKLAKECRQLKKYCILYCEDHSALDRTLYSPNPYTINANYGLTVLERVFNLLYFVKELR